MSFTTPYARNFFKSDGTTSMYSYTFDAITKDFLRVNVQHVDGTVDTDVNVTIPRWPNGTLKGQIVFGVDQVPEAGATIMIERITPETQDTNYTQSISFDAHAVDYSFDKLTAMVQEITDTLKTKTLALHPFQETGIALQQMKTANQGQYLFMDMANQMIAAGLFLEITNDTPNFANAHYRVSKDGMNWVNLPKATEIREFRQRVLPNPTRYIFEYRIGNTWYTIGEDGHYLIMNHSDLENRDAPDSHPISAITGLTEELNDLNTQSSQRKPRITGVIESTLGSDVYLGTDGLLHIDSAITVLFNKNVYYTTGNVETDFVVATIEPQTAACPTFTGTSTTFYLLANPEGQLQFTTIKPTGDQGGSVCLLGSGFAEFVDGAWKFQQDAFVFTPWISVSGKELRQSQSTAVSGGTFTGTSTNTVNVSAWHAIAEGINFGINRDTPDIRSFDAAAPWDYKYLFPGYDSTVPQETAILANKVFDTETQAATTITDEDKWVILVPMFTPTGQGIIPMPQGHVDTTTNQYTCLYNSYQEAVAHIYSATFDLTGLSTRLTPFGVSLICRTNNTGATSDPANMNVYPAIPKQFETFGTTTGTTSSGTLTGTQWSQDGVQKTGSDKFNINVTGAEVVDKGGENVEINVPIAPTQNSLSFDPGIVTITAENPTATIDFATGAYGKRLQIDTSAEATSAVTVNLSFPDQPATNSQTYELHINCTADVAPLIQWQSNKPFNWFTIADQQLTNITSDQCTVFVFRVQQAQNRVIANNGGSYTGTL